MAFFRTVSRQGSALCVFLPRPFLNALGISKGDQVAVSLQRGAVVIEPVTDSMLAQLRAQRVEAVARSVKGKP